MSFSRAIAVLGLCLASAGAAQASDAKGEVIACLAGMESETTWDQCRGMMFAPCADHSVGGEGHLACLEEEQTGWRAVLDERTTQLNDRLTTTGTAELSTLLGQWFGYVGNKCADVAAARAEISADAARLGCEISEIAGLVTELSACLAGQSTSPYCTLKD